jgi:hypothetical protein
MGFMDGLGLFIIGVGAIVVTIWEFVLLIFGLAEVHKFSKWVAAATILVWAIPVFIIYTLLTRLVY